jgi:hypothetical protein
MGDFTVRPTSGSERFRQNASLTIGNGELVVTDGRGLHHRFTLDKAQGGPALFCSYSVGVSRGSSPEQAIADSDRLAMVRTRPDLWDQGDLQGLADRLGLIVSDVLADAPTGNRQDCVDLFGVEGLGLQLVIWTLIAIGIVAVVAYALKAVLG